MIKLNQCIYLGLHDIISSYFASSMSNSDYYEEPSADEEVGAPGPSSSPISAAPSSSAVVVFSSSAISSGAVLASSAPSSSESAAPVVAGPVVEPVAGPSWPDTSVPVGAATPVVRRQPGLVVPGELRDGDEEAFSDLFNWGAVNRLEEWAVLARGTRGHRGIVVVFPPFSGGLANFLQQVYGRRWESRILSGQGEVLLFQLRCYILSYSRLTFFSKGSVSTAVAHVELP